VTAPVEALDACASAGYASSEEIIEVHNCSNGLVTPIDAALEGES
jgi:hypothetical protein